MMQQPRQFVPHRPKTSQRLIAAAAFVIEHLLTATLRWQWHDETGLFSGTNPQPVIFCLWHNRLALSMSIWRRWPQRHQPTRRLAGLVSASKDGALLAQILQNFGVQPVRGSTSRRGPQALLELKTWAEKGYDLAITPDGPRGPCYRMQDGVLGLAQVTGLPIVPVTCHGRWKVAARSWDRFQIPLPFGGWRVVFGKPVRIVRDASDEEREAARVEIEKMLSR